MPRWQIFEISNNTAPAVDGGAGQNAAAPLPPQFNHFNYLRKLVRLKLFFPVRGHHLIRLVRFCQREEFRGKLVLCRVLQRVFERLKKNPLRRAYLQEIFMTILEDKDSVDHFFSTCTAFRFRIGAMRINDLALEWLLGHVIRLRSNPYDYSVWDYDLLHEILKHGYTETVSADLQNEYSLRRFPREEAFVPVHHATDLLYLAIHSLYCYRKYMEQAHFYDTERASMILCIKVLVRALPRTTFRMLHQRGTVYQTLINALRVLKDTVSWLETQNIMPEIFGNNCHCVMPLQHLARYTVRKALYDNWTLPEGLKQIGIPTRIYDYICLIEN